MLNLVQELTQLVQRLDEEGIDYALCGGLALAVHSIVRATIDIDLLVHQDSLEDVKKVARSLGFAFEAQPMSLAKGAIRMHRLSKIEPALDQDALMLDLILVTPAIERAWGSRRQLEWEHGSLWVVDREGLIQMKKLRGSGQDLDDIQKLSD